MAQYTGSRAGHTALADASFLHKRLSGADRTERGEEVLRPRHRFHRNASHHTVLSKATSRRRHRQEKTAQRHIADISFSRQPAATVRACCFASSGHRLPLTPRLATMPPDFPSVCVCACGVPTAEFTRKIIETLLRTVIYAAGVCICPASLSHPMYSTGVSQAQKICHVHVQKPLQHSENVEALACVSGDNRQQSAATAPFTAAYTLCR
jgi:hypothetical protein